MKQVLGGFGWDPRCMVDCKQSGIGLFTASRFHYGLQR